MKAIVCTKYGPPDVLVLREVPKPKPKDNQVLVKIHATTVILGDCELRGLNFPYLSFGLKLLMRLGFGIRGPRKKILGQQLAGEIEEIGKDVTQYRVGDHVFGLTGFGMGAYAEYTAVRENMVMTTMPANMSYEEASTIPVGGLEALHYMSKANIQRGQQILINGAGGSIGTIAVQLAKNFGAEVTAVDSSGKFDMLRSLGSDHVIDYKTENFTERGETYDVIFDVVGVTSFPGCMNSLNENGIYLQGNGSVSRGDKSTARKNNKIAMAGPAENKIEHLIHLKELIEAGTIKAVIDRTFPLEEMVEVHRFVEKGGKLGNVVVTME
ncbi:MAG: NAD(P)-dependent alcohol dehydrogenase [Candidatus Thorarchaeota archaeon]|jgi:alcohol dehydrogenase